MGQDTPLYNRRFTLAEGKRVESRICDSHKYVHGLTAPRKQALPGNATAPSTLGAAPEQLKAEHALLLFIPLLAVPFSIRFVCARGARLVDAVLFAPGCRCC